MSGRLKTHGLAVSDGMQYGDLIRHCQYKRKLITQAYDCQRPHQTCSSTRQLNVITRDSRARVGIDQIPILEVMRDDWMNPALLYRMNDDLRAINVADQPNEHHGITVLVIQINVGAFLESFVILIVLLNPVVQRWATHDKSSLVAQCFINRYFAHASEDAHMTIRRFRELLQVVELLHIVAQILDGNCVSRFRVLIGVYLRHYVFTEK